MAPRSLASTPRGIVLVAGVGLLAFVLQARIDLLQKRRPVALQAQDDSP